MVADHVAAVLTHWLRRGAAGWRLDAAYAVPPAFWQRVLPPARAEHPDAWFVGGVIHCDYPAYVAASGLDSLTQYELWKAIWSSLNDRNLFELAWALDRHNRFAEAFLPLTFVGNHDVTRLATRLDEPRHLGHALAVLFTVAGTPSVYYGDEQAFRGEKEDRVGGDAAIRPAFPDRPAELAPWGRPVYALHQRLIELRSRHPWLARARSEMLHLRNESAALAVGPRDEGSRVLVLLHLGDEPYRFPLDASGWRLALDGAPGPAEAAEAAEAADGDPLEVPPHGWRVLEVS
jgi:cyclomaltodextrinase / maltogenic alpha-amylase / neopullulanase